MIEPLRTTFEVARPADQVFRTWTDNIAQWWPSSHTVSGERDVQVVLEPRLGGKIYERTMAGVVHEWGEITLWDPPHRFVFKHAGYKDATKVVRIGLMGHSARERSVVALLGALVELVGAPG